MKKFINFIMLISIVITNNYTFYADTIQSTCDLITASESTTANCNQKMLALQNGSFEDLGNLSFADYKIAKEADVLGWESTAPAGTIELWKKSFYESQHPGIDSSMIDGDVLAELNSSSAGALYQDFETEPGQIINIYAKHGGRIQKDLHGEQNMGVYVGVPRVNYSDTNYSAELYPTEGLSNDLMYSSAVLPGEWNEIAFQYVVPEGQTTTRIAFNSLDAGSMGNFIDEIKVGVDSVYDNEVTIESVTGGNSFADTYRVKNVLNHIGGDVIGKFEVVIDTSGLKNLRQFEIRDMNNNNVTNLTTIEYVEEDHIKISGDTFIEGTVTFVAESTLQETGQIVVDSDLKYVSELYLDFVRLGKLTSDGVLETRDITSLQLEDYAPVISYENVTVNEAELSSSVNIEELLKVSVEDKEDDITGFNTELIVDAGTIDYHKPGIYNVSILAVDGQGQTASETATITISDLQPKITSSINTVELPLGTNQDSVNYTQLFDVKASEITDGDLTSKLIVTSNVNFETTGLYTVNFLVTDDEGNTDTLDRTVKIVRNNHDDIETIDNGANARPEIGLTKLSLEVNEHNPLTASELISKYGVSVNDDFDTNLQINVDQSKVDYTKPGIYEIEFSTTDSKGLKAVQTAQLKVIDVLPVINAKKNTVELQLSEANDQIDFVGLFEVKASEITDGDLTSKLIVTSNVNFETTGLYTVNFLVTDDEGNTDTLDRTVKIVRNNHDDIETIDNGANARPEIGLTKLSLEVNEHNPLTASELISKYGVSVTDDFDTNLQINVDQSKVDYRKPGIYEIKFSTTDSKGLKAVQTAQLQVIDMLPAINGNKNNVELQLSDANDQIDFVGLFEVKATEITDGDLTSKISVDFSAVNFNATGSYTVSFLVTDDEGNAGTLDRTLTIVKNTHDDIETIDNGVNTRPEIGLTKLSLDVNEHTPLSASELISKYGVSVTDDLDTNLQITVDQSKVDYTKPGNYEIEFSTTDSKGLKAVQTAQLQVIDMLPAINGNKNNVELQLSDANDQIDFVELFEVKATEITDGDLTSKISVDFSAVNFNATGSYTVSFLVTDDEGNTDTLDRTIELVRNSGGDFETIDNGVNTRPEIELTKLSLDVNEHTPLSASELISKFGVSVTDDFDTNLQIAVDQSKVDYTKPGIYEIEFSVTDSKGLKAVQTAQLKVIDVLPVINTNKNTVELQLNDVKDPDQIDFIGLFNVVAKELSAGDLTSKITVDFREVDFNATGTYYVHFRVIDEEGNESLKTTKLVITRSILGDAGLISTTVDPVPVVDSENVEKENALVSEVETSAPKTTVDKEDTVVNEVSKNKVDVNSSNKSKSTKAKKNEVNNKNSEYKEMTINNKGQESMFILLIAALLGVILIKKYQTKK